MSECRCCRNCLGWDGLTQICENRSLGILYALRVENPDEPLECPGWVFFSRGKR